MKPHVTWLDASRSIRDITEALSRMFHWANRSASGIRTTCLLLIERSRSGKKFPERRIPRHGWGGVQGSGFYPGLFPIGQGNCARVGLYQMCDTCGEVIHGRFKSGVIASTANC